MNADRSNFHYLYLMMRLGKKIETIKTNKGLTLEYLKELPMVVASKK